MNNIDKNDPDTDKKPLTDLHYKKKQEELYRENLLTQLKKIEEQKIEATEEEKSSEKISVIQVVTKGILGTHFCKISTKEDLQFEKDQQIIYEHDESLEIAKVIETGYLASRKFETQEIPDEEISEFKRIVTKEDSKQLEGNIKDELKAKPIFFELVKKYELNMKLVDIHYQFDRKKLFFFYTSDGRVDFRELAKSLAGKFKTRIELRQIGVRDEAKILGGLGTCGREFCCSTFLGNFKRITTQIANEQNLSSNMSKLSGPCGKLKCCLSYEVDVVDLEKLAEVHLSGSESDPE